MVFNVFMSDCAFDLQKIFNVLMGSINNMYNVHTHVWKNQAFDISQIKQAYILMLHFVINYILMLQCGQNINEELFCRDARTYHTH